MNFQQELTDSSGRVFQDYHQRRFPRVKGIDVSVVLNQNLCKSNFVGLGRQVQQIAFLELDVVLPDAGLQSEIKICA